MAKTTIELTDEDPIDILVILNVMRRALDAEHGRGFFTTTPFRAIRARFPRDDDVFTPRPREIHLSDTELGALKAALEMQRWASGFTWNQPIYEKVLHTIDKRTSTLVGRLSLSRVECRARAKGYFGLEAVINQLAERA
jgi:hypothetical protein